MEQLSIILEFKDFMSELRDIEDEIERREYKNITYYPEEIEKLLKIRDLIRNLPEKYVQTKEVLLNKVFKLLCQYLSKGGILKGKDIIEFLADAKDKDVDLSIILPSLGLTEEYIKMFNEYIEKIEYPEEIRKLMKNEAIVLWIISKRDPTIYRNLPNLVNSLKQRKVDNACPQSTSREKP
jgi:protein associated with RNAse G/E